MMNKKSAQAFAAVLCRVVDYYHVRATAERISPLGSEDEAAQVARLDGAQRNVAEAIEAIPDELDGIDLEAHQVG